MKTTEGIKNMDLGCNKEQFESLSINPSVAQKFNNYCKSISKTPSITLELMVAFFEAHEMSPEDPHGETIVSLKELIIKRTNTVIAVIKSLEKLYHKPTAAILQTLFGQMSLLEADTEEAEVFDFGTPKLLSEPEELNHYKNAYYKAQTAYNDLKQETEGWITKMKFVRNNFGSGYYRLNMSKEDLDTLKQLLEHVYHHHPSETGS